MLFVASLIVVFSAWLPNLHLVTTAVVSHTLTFPQKTKLLLSLFGSLQTNFTLPSLFITFMTAILSGMQVSLLAYYLGKRAKAQKAMGMSFVGVISSMLGIGCASCGSVVLTSLFGLGSAATVLAILPFKGQEFGFIGVGLLLFANIWLVRKIEQPSVCEI